MIVPRLGWERNTPEKGGKWFRGGCPGCGEQEAAVQVGTPRLGLHGRGGAARGSLAGPDPLPVRTHAHSAVRRQAPRLGLQHFPCPRLSAVSFLSPGRGSSPASSRQRLP